MGPVVKGRFSSLPPDIIVWAFQAKQGELSPVVESSDLYVIARLDSSRAKGLPELAAIRPEIEGLVRTERKKAEAKKLGETIRERAIAPGGTLEAAAKAAGVNYGVVGSLCTCRGALQRQLRDRHRVRTAAEPDQPAGRRRRRTALRHAGDRAHSG
jgi:hypothetical protein